MSDPSRYDDRFTDPLVDYDERGLNSPPAAADSNLEHDLSVEEREQFEKAKACIDLLHAIKPWHQRERHELLSAEHLRPRFIGRFEIQGELGIGGFGIVYQAWDEVTERLVAVKVPRIEALASADLRGRFEQEARAAARLDHPNIATVLDAGVDGTMPYIATLYYPGATLAAWLKLRTAPLEGRLAARLLIQLSDAIAHAHDRGVLHRDIKPSNVLMVGLDVAALDSQVAQAQLKLMDFGLAKLTAETQDWTQSGMLLGTVRYMPPEQAAGRLKEIGPASDVYALGAVLYELLTGKPPFAAESDFEVLRRIESTEPSRVRSLNRHVDHDLETICLKCLEKKPAHRYPTARALVEDLNRYLEGRPILARRSTPSQRFVKWVRRNPVWAALFALAIMSTAVVLVISIWFNLRLKVERDHALESEQRARESEQRALANERLATRREFDALNHAYSLDIRQAEDALTSNLPDQAEKWLSRHLPKPGQPDLRDFSWWYLHRQIEASKNVLVKHGGRAVTASNVKKGWVATSGGDGIVRIWNLEKQSQVLEFKAHLAAVSSLAFTPDGERLVTAGSDFLIKVWQLPEAKLIRTTTSGIGMAANVAVSLDGKRMAFTASDKSIRVWDLEQDKLLGSLRGHKDVIKALIFGNDWMLFSSGEDWQVRAWNTQTMSKDPRVPDGLFPRTPQINNFIVYTLTLDATGRHLLGGMWDNGFESWDVSPEHFGVIEKWDEQAIRTARCAVADVEDVYCFGSAGGTMQFIRVPPAGETFQLAVRHGMTGRINSVATLPDSPWLVAGTVNGSVNLVNKPIYARGIKVGRTHNSMVVDWNGDLLASGHDRNLVVIDLQTRKQIWKCPAPVAVFRARLAPRRQKILLTGAILDQPGEELSAWSLDHAECLWKMPITNKSSALALDNAEDLFAIGDDKSLLVGELSTGRIRWRLPHPKEISGAEFVDDTNVLVTASLDGHVRFWDVTTGQLTETQRAHTTAAQRLSVAKGGQRLLTSGDNKISVWERSPWREIATVPEREWLSNAVLLGKGDSIAVQFERGLTIWRVADSSEVMDLRGDIPVDNISRGADGQALAVQSSIAVSFIDGHAEPEITPQAKPPASPSLPISQRD